MNDSASQTEHNSLFLWFLDCDIPDSELELEVLLGKFTALRASNLKISELLEAFDRAVSSTILAAQHFSPSLRSSLLPLERNVRKKTRLLKKLLFDIADEGMLLLARIEEERIDELSSAQLKLLWSSLSALSQHLFLSFMTSSSAEVGAWQMLHRVFNVASYLGFLQMAPQRNDRNLHDLYCSAILLSCAQPMSLTPLEIDFVADYLMRFGQLVNLEQEADSTSGTFWIDPLSDFSAAVSAKRPVPPGTHVRYFSCNILLEKISEQLTGLDDGLSTHELGLPELAEGSLGQEMLRKLLVLWGAPPKRRFLRRRQNTHARLCAGLGNLCELFLNGENEHTIISDWIVINESPDGYAVMHSAGETGVFSVGDVVAVQSEEESAWQVCIIRWAASQNKVHFELGLQSMGISPSSANLIMSEEDKEPLKRQALSLFGVGALRSKELLVVASERNFSDHSTFTLVWDQEKIIIREINSLEPIERNERIEVYSPVFRKPLS